MKNVAAAEYDCNSSHKPGPNLPSSDFLRKKGKHLWKELSSSQEPAIPTTLMLCMDLQHVGVEQKEVNVVSVTECL